MALTASTIGASGQIVVMEVAGDYNVELPDGSSNALARAEVAREFYRLHPDQYDFLIIASNFDFQMPKDAIAFYQPVKNDTQGIGAALLDNTALFGSNGKLQGTIDLGNLAHLTADPTEPRFSDTMATLSHELLHRWAAFVRYRKADSSIGVDLLGKDSVHWSYLLDTGASLELGNNWQDNGNGSFTSGTNRRYYGPLDLYLMGLIAKEAVPPMLLIENPAIDPARLSESGVTINGLARYVTIDDIIAVEGERIPGVNASQKSFRIACVFITRPGTFSGYELSDIDSVIQAWPLWFSALTNGIGKISVDSAPSAVLPENPGPRPPAVDPRTAPRRSRMAMPGS